MKILSMIGKFAAKQVPGIGTILDGIELVGNLIGGDTGKKITEGLGLVTDGLNEVGKTPLTPEQQVEMEAIQSKTALGLKELAYKDKKLSYDDASGGRDVVMTALQSDDKIVRQARPLMMIRLGIFAMVYTMVTPVLIMDMAWLGISAVIIDQVVSLILWQGGTLWTAFMTAFTGYTIARSADKSQVVKLNNGETPSNVLSQLSKLGHFVSGSK